jgi:hypothetical protein
MIVKASPFGKVKPLKTQEKQTLKHFFNKKILHLKNH